MDYRQELVEKLYGFRHDPLGYVLYNYPWKDGELVNYSGPRVFQREVLDYIGKWFSNSLTGADRARFGQETRDRVCRIAISSGQGPGKTTLGVWVASWAKDTFLDAMVRVTANTDRQLTTVMQPEYARWHRRALNADDWSVHSQSIKADDPAHDDTWRIDLMPWSQDNPQAFAGKHNAGRRMVFIIEEASEVSDEIFRVANGALTDENTEKLFLIISNPTRNTGYFYEAVFGAQRDRWKSWVIDSRDVEGCNVDEINGWLAECEGNDDADYFRVRARGLFPKGASGQFIDLDLIHKAQRREAVCLSDDPVVAGCDLAWGGSDDNVIRFRKGNDARSIPPIRIKGEFTRDPAVMIDKITRVLSETYNGEKVSMMFCDSAGIAGSVVTRVRQLGFQNIMEVNFGADSPDPHCAYMRDFMWSQMRQGLIDGLAIDNDPGLAADLSKPMLVSDLKQRTKLESKEIMMRRLSKLGIESSSPDDGDALALTYRMPVQQTKVIRSTTPQISAWERSGDGGWMG